MDNYDYVNGYIERNSFGNYAGVLTIEGINLSHIEGQYFKQDGETYLFIKRKPVMEYDYAGCCYRTREPRPQVHIYMKKEVNGDGVVAYKGEFMFMRFKFHIVGVWDFILGKERNRLNLFVERAATSEQTLLQSIKERKRNEKR